MKRILMMGCAFGFITSAHAQSNGYYEFIPYYNNDPFTFCTVGVPQDCWTPISKEFGTFTVTNPYCFNAYSAQLFARVCPKAFPYGPLPPPVTASVDPANADAP